LTLHCAASELSDTVLAEAAAAGVPVLCYTVNDPAEAEVLIKRGVSSLFTDRLDLFA
jgi:glycerophosphoryl diester phosphodiesterase